MPDALPPPTGDRPSLPPPPSSLGPPPPPPGLGTTPLSLGRSPSDTGGLRKATVILYWCVSGVAVLLAAALISRKATWTSFSNGDSSLGDLQDADDFVGASAGILFLVAIAALIVLSLWSYRTARHARATGASDVSPGLSCGGWYIPFGNLVVPYVQLRRIAGHRGRRTTMVSLWQGFAIGLAVLSLILRIAGNTDETAAEDLSGRLTTQAVVGVLVALAAMATAFVAMRAMKDVDAV